MKTYITKLTLGLISVGLLSACATGQMAQTSEYDDLYFTASDRNTVEFTKLNDPKKAEYQRGSYVYEQQSFSSKNVNPEYIARYNNAGNQQNPQQQNPQQQADAQNDEYYIEEFEREDVRYAEQPQVVNNFFGAGPYSTFGNPAFNRWGGFNSWGAFHDPFMMDPFMMDPFFGPTAFGHPGFGFGRGFGMGLNVGFGFGFGNAWAYRPWRDPFFRPWGFRNAYAMGFYNGFYGGGFFNRPNVVIINNNESLGVNRRRVTNGNNIQRATRASVADRNITRARGRSVGDRNAPSTARRGQDVSRARSGTRDFTRTQNEYYRRSRSNARTAESGRAYRSTTPASRSSRTYSSSEAARSSRSGSYTRSRSTSPSRSYSRGSYSSGSRSGSYNNSRSSGSYNRGSYNSGGSRSRSSGSYSRGSYGGSRSSGSPSRGGSSGGSRGSRGGGR